MQESKLNLPEATRAMLRKNYERLKAIKIPEHQLVFVSRYFMPRFRKNKDGSETEYLVPSKGRTYVKEKAA